MEDMSMLPPLTNDLVKGANLKIIFQHFYISFEQFILFYEHNLLNICNGIKKNTHKNIT